MPENLSIATFPQEILCKIFSYLDDHPIHLTRVAQVCRTWNFAADNHLFWRQLIKTLQLPDPKPRAYKYKTYKSIILKNWGKFCTSCNVRRTRNNGLRIQPVIIDTAKIGKIDFGASRWFKVVLKNPGTQRGQLNNDNPQFLNHLLCRRCHSIYKRYVREEKIRNRRDLLSAKLGELGLTLPDRHNRCYRFVLFGDGNPTNIAQELAKVHFTLRQTSEFIRQ